jgi:light-regulated signal transduction histidine kinase (bacteriophytochrome)
MKKYHPKSTYLHKKGENEWIFSIKDNGIGIESKHQDQIFEVFKSYIQKKKNIPVLGSDYQL